MEQVLQVLEKYARQNNIPVLLDDSAKFLANSVEKKQFLDILEIGTAVGYSGSIMLLASKNAYLTTIEKNEESFNKAINTFHSLGLNNRVTQILGDGLEQINKL